GGACAQALFWMALDRDRAMLWAQRALAILAETEVDYGLLNGLAGICWTTEQLRDPDGDDPNADVDSMLLELLEDLGPEENLDLISGLSGVAVYAAERMPLPSAAALLRALADRVVARAIPLPQGLAWIPDPSMLAWQRAEGTPAADYNLGLAHGMPGPLSVLALATAWGVGDYRRPLEQGMATLVSLCSASPFPASFGPTGQIPARGVAWCYGGAGVGTWLRAMGALMQRPDWRRQGEDLLRHHLHTHLDIRSACLCHGDASLALMLHLLADPELAPLQQQAVDRLSTWLEQGAPRPPERENITPSSEDILEGAAGGAMVLARLAGLPAPPWERLLLFDLRGPRS
ncbi:MAG TPA: lanthionine synthetase LanC family protein, partial [Myxococcota bacterium]|nr:lanthionine synthetase LanC family protein [Myxococcota bacterium]